MTLPEIAILCALSLAVLASAVLAVVVVVPPAVAVLGLVGAMVPVWGVVSLGRGRY